MSVEVIRAEALAAVPHGFLGRRGGVSGGFLAGLNVSTGSGDDAEAIAENRRRAVNAVLPGAELATVFQVHSGEAAYADAPWPHEERPRADALVTDKPGLLLGILTADCAPVLFADPEAGVVGAAHAGWRGALAGVTDSAIAAMEQLGARRERIVAAVGPCIGAKSYEVDDAFRARFVDFEAANSRFFTQPPGGKPHFDLEAYAIFRLRAAGVEDVTALGLDTYADAGRFYSHRRSTHHGEPNYGRQLSLIGLGGCTAPGQL